MTSDEKLPLWQQIEATLRHEIASGQYQSGEKLPTEADLAKRFGVNRHTVRRAIAQLQTDGLVLARRGAGVFVASKPMLYPLGRRVRFHESLTRAGQTASKSILRLQVIGSTERAAEALNVSVGDPVVVWEGLGLADQTPISLFQSWFPAKRLPGIEDALGSTHSVTEALAAVGVPDYTRASTEISAEVATALQARHLRVSPGVPLLRTVAINVDADQRPVEFGRTWFAGDRVKLTV